jgi:plastocyanin
MRRFVVVALAPVLVVVAAGCGSSSKSSSIKSSTPAAAPAPGAVAIGVRETEYKLTPPNISPKSGKHTILAMNQGKVTHAIEVEGGGASGKDVRSTDIAPGQSATITVDLKPGKTYTWYCPVDGHRGLGMKGQIAVAGSSGSSSSGQSQTSTSGSSGGSGAGSKGAY